MYLALGGSQVKVLCPRCGLARPVHTAEDRQRYLNYVSSRLRTVPRGGQIQCTRLIREMSIALVLIALGCMQPVLRVLSMVRIGRYMGGWLRQTYFSSAITHQNGYSGYRLEYLVPKVLWGYLVAAHNRE